MRTRRQGRRRDGDGHDEGAAGWLIVFDPDAAAMRVDGDAAEGEAQALPERAEIGLLAADPNVLVEDALAHIRRNTGSAIVNAESHRLAVAARLHDHRLSWRAVAQ